MVLKSDTDDYFNAREQAMLAMEKELEERKSRALSEADQAMQRVKSQKMQALQRPNSRSLRGFDQLVAEKAIQEPSKEVPASSFSAATPTPRLSARAPPSAPATEPAIGDELESLRGTIRFQKARIQALQEELDAAVKGGSERGRELHELKEETKNKTEENAKLERRCAMLEKENEKLLIKATKQEERAKAIDEELHEVKKDYEQLQILHRKMDHESRAKDTRIARMTEEVEKAKVAVREARSHQKEKTVCDKRESDRMLNEIRKLERQRAELIGAFKKQMKLIDVLKRQKIHVEAARLLSFTEEEFISALELGGKLK
ncbi:Testis expressed 9 [Perkinsus chesapeaki]|uniref:Testis expressed 9 n=1 Tax=Perkinsus chesapeaki TaxID=330153 RepID=A0A7J6MN13_PERCH|nr:Testis expressed 9 [Perkinsus chesapeaki]